MNEIIMYFSNLSYSFDPDMVFKCDLCDKTFKKNVNLEDMFEVYMKNRDINAWFVRNFLRENIHLQIMKSCILGRMIDSAPKPITRKVFMINMIKYVYNKIDD